ncbi:MAG: hypothetical protein Q9157_000510 [Trypethelium eluteriae]
MATTFQPFLRSRWAKLLAATIAALLAFSFLSFATQLSFKVPKWNYSSQEPSKLQSTDTTPDVVEDTKSSPQPPVSPENAVQPESPTESLQSASEEKLDYWTWETHSRFRSRSQISAFDGHSDSGLCAGFPTYILADIQVSLRIGINADKAKVGAQLSSVARCIENLLIFSDLDDRIGDRRVYDVLAELPQSYRQDNPDFETYDKQKQLRAEGRLEHSNSEGWKLDRFKFLPMMEKAFEMRPNVKWYVFMEDDTYFFWDNLFRFLDNLDPDTPKYMGSPSPGKEAADGKKTWFAYGGTGFVVSRAAMKKLLARKVGPHGEYLEPSLSARYVDDIKGDCCGDSILGWAFWNAGVPLSGHWPSFCPHPIGGIPYSELYWCEPALSLHRSLPQDMIGLWKWEQERRYPGVSSSSPGLSPVLLTKHSKVPSSSPILSFISTLLVKKFVPTGKMLIGMGFATQTILPPTTPSTLVEMRASKTRGVCNTITMPENVHSYHQYGLVGQEDL